MLDVVAIEHHVFYTDLLRLLDDLVSQCEKNKERLLRVRPLSDKGA